MISFTNNALQISGNFFMIVWNLLFYKTYYYKTKIGVIS